MNEGQPIPEDNQQQVPAEREPVKQEMEKLIQIGRAELAETRRNLYRELPHALSHEQRLKQENQLTSQFVQAEPGLYGLRTQEGDVPVTKLIAAYQTYQYQKRPDEERMDKLGTIAREHGVSPEAVDSAMVYYYRHRPAIDAYFEYQKGLQTTDPLFNDQQT